MSSYFLNDDLSFLQIYVPQLEKEGLVKRTFRRLDPDRQQAILNAILDELIEKPLASINIKHIARRAGVAIGSMYQYFPNRDAMVDFAVEVCTRSLVEAFDQCIPYLVAMPVREALVTYLASGIEWSQQMAGFMRLFARAAYQGDERLSSRLVLPIATVMRRMVAEIFERAVERGELKIDPSSSEMVARFVNGFLIAVGDSILLPYLNVYFQTYDDRSPRQLWLENAIDFILKGMLPPGTADQ